ncbi:carboxymuconolactone decarboxylase family protein [Kitasatospora purpeofusca]|uniref:carboxymuconolactone decarboxylase family protein n=1 Tax=Kitasatospora purpeofusca TaxID=67352 RepID=UPI002A5A1CE9|nr:carboxymuconolactone decarboxylase family protein [Kitasatospora purpeofusca]MDY0810951.1 carboxymuconolactone decarboxylase family protein [Kitasatospora purpeofusca]
MNPATTTPTPPADRPLGAGLVPSPFDRAAGHALLAELAGDRTRSGTLGPLDELAPGFADWIVTALFGGTYQRPGLALRDRQVANLAALTALGGVEPQLADHVRNSLRIGLTRTEVTEVLVHLAPYVGVPKALAGLRVAAAVFTEAEEEGTAAPDGPDAGEAAA